MKQSLVIMLLLLIVGLAACQKQDDIIIPPDPYDTISEEDKNWDVSFLYRKESSRHFINSYNDPMGFQGSITHNKNGSAFTDFENTPLETDYVFFYIHSNADIHESNIDKVIYDWRPGNYQPAKFDSIARTVGDTLNDKPYSNSYFWTTERFLFRPCQFHFTTLDNYDEDQPKGSRLDSITQIRYYTAMPYIKSNYKNKRLGDCHLYTIELLSSFNKKDISLIKNDISFRLAKRPAVTGRYSFSITYTDNSGKTFTLKTIPLYLLGVND